MADTNATISIEPEKKEQTYYETEKFNAWVRLFYDKNNKKTYRNRTQSALEAYNLDPDTQYFSAGVVGHENFKKLKNVASMYLEEQGFTYDTLLNIALKNATESKMPSWWLIVAELGGVYTKKPEVVIQNNTQVNNNTTVTMDDPNIKTFQEDFAEFLEGKYNAKK